MANKNNSIVKAFHEEANLAISSKADLNQLDSKGQSLLGRLVTLIEKWNTTIHGTEEAILLRKLISEGSLVTHGDNVLQKVLDITTSSTRFDLLDIIMDEMSGKPLQENPLPTIAQNEISLLVSYVKVGINSSKDKGLGTACSKWIFSKDEHGKSLSHYLWDENCLILKKHQEILALEAAGKDSNTHVVEWMNISRKAMAIQQELCEQGVSLEEKDNAGTSIYDLCIQRIKNEEILLMWGMDKSSTQWFSQIMRPEMERRNLEEETPAIARENKDRKLMRL